ncbi:MAG: two-component system phosphate regulon sensor histidine kinase PhoR [Lentimonas sp.]|jgi:two-component system phosphate regulon sensor histidine kinase PhoR
MLKTNSINRLITVGVMSLIAIIALQFFWFKSTYSSQVKQKKSILTEDSLAQVDINDNISELIWTLNVKFELKPNTVKQSYFSRTSNSRDILFSYGIADYIRRDSLSNFIDRLFSKNKFNILCVYSIYDVNNQRIIATNPTKKDIPNSEFHKTKLIPKRQIQDSSKVNRILTLKIVKPRNSNFSISKMVPGWIIVVVILAIIILFFGLSIAIVLKQKNLSTVKNDFINNMTHELKTPIATIGLSSEMLLRNDFSDDPIKLKNYAGIIFKENKRLENQVERVLNIAKMDRDQVVLKKSPVEIHELLLEVKDSFEFKYEEDGGEFNLALHANNEVIMLDEVHISNVLYNLLDNATKYCTGKPRISIRTKDDDRNFILEIEDNGNGIKRENLKFIFEKFYRVHTGNRHDVKGFGLGLFYVKRIIEAHKGRIEVKSTYGVGTTFCITLPLEKLPKQ